MVFSFFLSVCFFVLCLVMSVFDLPGDFGLLLRVCLIRYVWIDLCIKFITLVLWVITLYLMVWGGGLGFLLRWVWLVFLDRLLGFGLMLWVC